MKKVILCMLMVFTTSVTIMAQKQAIYDRSSITVSYTKLTLPTIA